MKTGLILEGGAMRGLFTCGILDIFMENHIVFDGAAGVSAGAVFGCNYKSGQIGRPIRYNKKYCTDKRYASFSSLIKTGDLYGVEFCYHELPQKLDVFDTDAFTANPMDFYIVTTNVETGKAIYHKCTDGKDNDIEWMRASASMPLVSKIVEIGPYKLLDGGVADSIPLKFMEHKGYDRNVVILTRPADYRKKPNKLMPLIKRVLKRYPAMVKAMENRHIRYNKVLDYIHEKERSGEILVIYPPEPLNVGGMEKNPEELERVYQLGRKVGKDVLSQVQTFLQRE